MGMSESVVEKVIARLMAYPANRFLRMKRSLSLLVSDRDGDHRIVQGTYQSPILVQWDKSERQSRQVDVTVTELV